LGPYVCSRRVRDKHNIVKRIALIIALLFALNCDSLACTSAAVAPHRSSEGVPLLWKHRDNSFSNTRVDYITGGTYAYTAIVPNNKNYWRGVYAGINKVGLGVITTATKNLPSATEEEWAACPRKRVRVGLSRYALRECATVDEFEEMLRTTKRKRGFNSNLGVADGTGAVAYFEVWDLGYRRYDVGERTEGFDIRTNFSHARIAKTKGASERRYNLMMNEMNNHRGRFSPQDFIGYSRSFNSVKMGNILANNNTYFCSNHTVPRYSTVGAFVLVCDRESPRMLVMNGHSVSSIAVPVYVNAGSHIPQCVQGDAMRLLSEDFREKAYHKMAEKKFALNKEVVRKVLKIKQPKIVMPQDMPQDIHSFNIRIDQQFAKHEQRVRKVLSKF